MSERRPRVAIYAMFSAAEQYELAAEYQRMLELLGSRCDVLHLSMQSPRRVEPPAGVTIKEYELHVDRSKPGDINKKSLLQFVHLGSIARHLREFKPDVIFIPDIIPLLPYLLQQRVGVPVVSAYGDWHIHNKLGKKWWAKLLVAFAYWLEKFEARRVAYFTCRAVSAKHRLMGMGVADSRIRVFHDAPAPESFHPEDQSALRARCGFKPDDVVLLYHGVMHQGKGIDKLITWTAEMRKDIPNIGLILVGAGPESAALQALAKDVGIADRTHFTGWLKTTREVGAYCNAADICVAMRTGADSNVHIIPGALLHSMACRKVVIGPKLPGIEEVLRHGENGFMFKADDADDFKKLIRALAANRADWPRVAALAEQEIHNRFSVDATAQNFAAAIESFAKDGKMPR